MKIYFCPEYAGNVFLNHPSQTVMMDTVVMNTVGLVNWLELRMGLHVEDIPQAQRVALYYDAMTEYMRKNPSNALSSSFNLAGLATAKMVLSWRDELRAAGWDFDGQEISDRLKVIVGIEEYYSKNNERDLPIRLHVVSDQIAFQKLDCHDVIISIPCELKLMQPSIRELLITLQEIGGAQIVCQKCTTESNSNLGKIQQLVLANKNEPLTLDPKDESFTILHFQNEWEANRYLSYQSVIQPDVWVNAENKQMDDWLTLMGKPTTGSNMLDSTPQLTQLFVLGMALFAEPLNIYTVIEWLNMPMHPLEKFFRSVLASTIVDEGGVRNEECQQVIRRYIDGEFVYLDKEQLELSQEEQAALRAKGRKQRVKNVSVFLPSMEPRTDIPVSDFRAFIVELQGWAKKKSFLLTQLNQDDWWNEQLNSIVSMTESFLILLDTMQSDVIDFKTIDNWMSTIYSSSDYRYAVAEKGGRLVVDSPAKLISVASQTVWMGLDSYQSHALECAFLFPSEKEALIKKNYISHWDEHLQNQYYEYLRLLPLFKTQDKLTLVICDRKMGEECTPHPLMVRLKQLVKNLDVFMQEPSFSKEELEEIEPVKNGGVSAELQFDYSDKLKWPDHLSPTVIEKLIDYPLDFLLDKLLDITSKGKAQMADLKRTKGNVAHAVIAALFAPHKNETVAVPEEIEKRIQQEYERTYEEVVGAHGAILLLPENKFEKKLLATQLFDCLTALLDILKQNQLKVTGCERYISDFMHLGLPENPKEETKKDVLGYIDMTLEDEVGNAVVFDFKWTNSRNYYQNLLIQNRSVQLELYRSMLAHSLGRVVSKVGYFLMPQGYLYSRESFKGSYYKPLNLENPGEIISQIKHAIVYRKAQLDRGIVETNGAFQELQYVKDTKAENLLPLTEDEKQGTKLENTFSVYGLFNA